MSCHGRHPGGMFHHDAICRSLRKQSISLPCMSPLGEVVRWSYSSRLDRRGENEIVSDFRRHETERFFTIFVMSLGTIVVDGK